MLAVAASQIRAIEEAVVGRIRRCRQRLKQMLDAPPDVPIPPRPFGFYTPSSIFTEFRQEKQFNAHLDAWLRDLEALQGLVKKMAAVLTHQTLTTAAGIVEADRKAIAGLRQRMAEAATAIGKKHHEGMPRRLGVNRVLISPECFEEIYADRIRQAGSSNLNDAVKKLVVEDRLLAGFRNATGRAACNHDSVGRTPFFSTASWKWGSIPFSAMVVTCDTSPSRRTFFAGLWERADPLIDTNRAVLPDGWTIGEFSAIWLPNPNNPQVYGPSLAARGGSLHMNIGSTTSIDLCRVIHGFTVPSMTLLRVYVTSYNAELNKTELHILDWIDRLPSLPEP